MTPEINLKIPVGKGQKVDHKQPAWDIGGSNLWALTRSLREAKKDQEKDLKKPVVSGTIKNS